MASVNKIILIGHLGQNPEVKIFDNNKVVNVSLATSEKYTDRQGNTVENVEWHTLEIWGNQAEIAEKYLTKGSLIYVEGKLKTDRWEKDGHKFQKHKVRVSSMIMLGSKNASEQAESSTPPPPPPHQSSQAPTQSNYSMETAPEDDDLPF